ncbi:MAG TPA: hypothetical protein VGN64_17390, partial [Dyadobacter sp.]|nr:hypothetical protein [Dyadobacter sp.]
ARPGLKMIQEEIMEKQIELTECRSSRPVKAVAKVIDVPQKGASRTVYPVEGPDPGIRQDLKVIEGIGPKIEEILNKHGIQNYTTLASVPALRIASILRGAGPRFQIHDPTSWPEQAALAHEEKWDELDTLKQKLIGGR